MVLAGRRADMLNEVAKAIGPDALAVPTDVADPKSVKRCSPPARRSSGVWTCCSTCRHGAPGTILLEDLSIEMWQNVVNVNLSGVFYCMQEAFRMMKEQSPQGGRIINNGSISAHAPRPNSATYTSTKHAVTGLTKSGSLDGRKYDIAVCQIDIAMPDGHDGEDEVRHAAGQRSVAPEPTMNVENVARTVLYMASLPLEANAQFVTVMATKMPYIGRG